MERGMVRAKKAVAKEERDLIIHCHSGAMKTRTKPWYLGTKLSEFKVMTPINGSVLCALVVQTLLHLLIFSLRKYIFKEAQAHQNYQSLWAGSQWRIPP